MEHGDMEHGDMEHGEMEHGAGKEMPDDADHQRATTAPAQPEHGGGSMLDAQSLWDATMAWSIAEHLTKRPGSKVAHMVGGFHSETGTGTPGAFTTVSPRHKHINRFGAERRRSNYLR